MDDRMKGRQDEVVKGKDELKKGPKKTGTRTKSQIHMRERTCAILRSDSTNTGCFKVRIESLTHPGTRAPGWI